MTRSSKSNAGSLRKQPATRRTRKAKGRKKRGSTLSKPPAASSTNKSTSRPAAHYESSLGASKPQASRPISLSANDDRAADSDRTPAARPRQRSSTERPVAHSVKPRASQAHDKREGLSPLAVAAGALVIGGALWFGLRQGEPATTAAPMGELATVVDEDRPEPAMPEPAVGAQQKAAAPSALDAPEQPSTAFEPEQEGAKARPTTRVAHPARRASPQKVAAEAAEPEAAIGPFDADAVNQALTAAADQASTCREAGDPTGVAKVVVTFAPSGRVTSATIGGPPFAGTSTGSCIAKTMRAMRLPPFEGDYRTVSKTVVIM